MFGLTRLRMIEIGVALLLTVAALLFAGLTWAAEARMQVSDAWARPTVGQARVSAAYMTIANESGSSDRLKAVRADKAEAVELHQTTMTPEGMMQMREIKTGLPVAAGERLVLDPGGAHLMLLGLEDALKAGDELTVTLEFDRAGAIDVVVPVRATKPN